MKVNWFIEEDRSWEHLIIAGDVGGTNTNIAVVGKKGSAFDIILECVFPSDQVQVFLDTVEETVAQFQTRFKDLPLSACCISAAGVVQDNYCKMTNQDWGVDGKAISAKFGIPTELINDFTAISYGLPLLDVNNPEQIAVLAHPDGTTPEATGSVRAVAGAGTGLGVGFLINHRGQYHACPSEGGHMDLAPYNEETKAIHDFMTKRLGKAPGFEPLVSGMGLTNLFYYFTEVKGVELSPVLQDIADTEDRQKPPKIAMGASKDPVCRQIMDQFIDFYGRVASNICAILLPSAGFYLAGGIVSKNLPYFVEGNRFMKSFEQNYAPHIRKFLKTVPVYVIKDYSISLYGAANAGYSLLL